MTTTRKVEEFSVRLSRTSDLSDLQQDKQLMQSAIVSSDLYRSSMSFQAHRIAALPILRSWLASGMRFCRSINDRRRIG